MKPNALGRDWVKHRGQLVNLGISPQISKLVAELNRGHPVFFHTRLGGTTMLRVKSKIVRCAIVVDPKVVLSFTVPLGRLLYAFLEYEEERPLRILFNLGMQTVKRSADLTGAEAKRWIGV